MAETWLRTAQAQAATGREALAGGRWAQARRAFRASIAEDETAAALEGLSWAGWWLDDEAEVFAARERAYRCYRAVPDPAGAARMAIWLAVDEIDFRGAAAPANGWLRRARRLLAPLEPGPEHGWLAFHEGHLAHAASDTAVALERAGRASSLGRRLRVADLEMLGLALEGAVLVACGRVREGLRDLDEAAAVAQEGEAEIPISAAWTFCLLVSACVAVLDFERAAHWSDRVAAFADRYGSRWMLACCRAEYGQIHLWRGRWDAAEAMLEAAIVDFEASRPPWAGAPLATLAELRRRQGRTAEAAELAARAGRSTRAQVCTARLALDAGRARVAIDVLERALRRLPLDRTLDRAPVLALLVHARAALGDDDEGTLAVLRAVAGAAGTPAMAATADRADGVQCAARGEHETARRLLEDATDGFEHAGATYEAAIARLELAPSLRALGRAAAADREEAIARAALAAYGAAPARAGPLAGLTPREHEVAGLLAEGLTNRQIAERLVISEHTVHRHVTTLLRKLGVPSRAAVAALAARAAAG